MIITFESSPRSGIVWSTDVNICEVVSELHVGLKIIHFTGQRGKNVRERKSAASKALLAAHPHRPPPGS